MLQQSVHKAMQTLDNFDIFRPAREDEYWMLENEWLGNGAMQVAYCVFDTYEGLHFQPFDQTGKFEPSERGWNDFTLPGLTIKGLLFLMTKRRIDTPHIGLFQFILQW